MTRLLSHGVRCPMVENDLLRAPRVKFDTLLTGADYQSTSGLRMQPKAISGCAGGSSCGSAGVLGRRALRSSGRTQALVSSSDTRVASQSQVDDKFADHFVPYRRAISCDSDLDSLHLLAQSVSGPSVSRGQFLVFLSVVVHVSVSLGHDAGFLRNM